MKENPPAVVTANGLGNFVGPEQLATNNPSPSVIQTFSNVPTEIRAPKQWICWKLQQREGAKPTKLPINPHTGQLASVTNPDDWGSYDEAVAASQRRHCEGIGFVITKSDPYTFVDLDDTHGDDEARARQLKVFQELNSYSEISPSGQGLHIIVKATLPGKGRRRDYVEIYDNERYMTVTGNVYHDVAISDAQEIATNLWEQLGGPAQIPVEVQEQAQSETDDAIIVRASHASNSDKFVSLYRGDWSGKYPSQSEADFALINIIAFYTQNLAQIARIFRKSALGQRDKAKRDAYLAPMIEKSFDNVLQPIDLTHVTCKGTPLSGAAIQLNAVPAGVTRFQLLNGAAVAALPPVVWRVHGIFPAQGVVTIYGPSTSGKSFISLSMAIAIAEGRPWFEYRVKPAIVVYVALEGQSGIKARVQAWEVYNHRTLPQTMYFVLQPFKLTDPGDVQSLASEIRALGDGAVVFIDTLNRAASDVDENSSQGMGAVLSGAAELQRRTGGLIVIVHHTGKDAQKGARGHSSLFAAMDAMIETARNGDARSWQVAKSKDGRDGALHAFRLEVAELGNDADGEPITSCVIVPIEDAPKPKATITGSNRIALDALGDCRGSAIPPPQNVLDGLVKCQGNPLFPPFAVVPEAVWRERCYKMSISDGSQSAKAKAFGRSRKVLLDLGLVVTHADHYWPPEWCAQHFNIKEADTPKQICTASNAYTVI